MEKAAKNAIPEGVEKVLCQVTLSGVVTPQLRKIGAARASEYKLVCADGSAYFLVADAKWRRVLSQLSWLEVRVVGLLNPSNRSLIPEKVLPKGPKGERGNAGVALTGVGDLLKNFTKTAGDLAFVSAAVWALIAI
ncbi:MAG: hypothetical protein ACXVA9_07115 [Bdellovibrionales bacterium]